MSSIRSYTNSSDADISEHTLQDDTRETSWLSIDVDEDAKEDELHRLQQQQEKMEDETLWDIIREALDEIEEEEEEEVGDEGFDGQSGTDKEKEVGVELKARISRVVQNDGLDCSTIMDGHDFGGVKRAEVKDLQDELNEIKKIEVEQNENNHEGMKEEEKKGEIAVKKKEEEIVEEEIEKARAEEQKLEVVEKDGIEEKTEKKGIEQGIEEEEIKKSEGEKQEDEQEENRNVESSKEAQDKETYDLEEGTKQRVTGQELYSTAYWDAEAAARVDLADQYPQGEALSRWLEEPPPVPPKDDVEDIDIHYNPPPIPPKDDEEQGASAPRIERRYSTASSFYSVYAQLPSVYIPPPAPVPPIPQQFRPTLQNRLPISRPPTTSEEIEILLPPLPPKPTISATLSPPPPPLSITAPFYTPPRRKPLSKPPVFPPPRWDSLQNLLSHKYPSSSIYDEPPPPAPSPPPPTPPPKDTITDSNIERPHGRRWGMPGIECLLPTNFVDSMVGLDMPDIARAFVEKLPNFGRKEEAVAYTLAKLEERL